MNAPWVNEIKLWVICCDSQWFDKSSLPVRWAIRVYLNLLIKINIWILAVFAELDILIRIGTCLTYVILFSIIKHIVHWNGVISCVSFFYLCIKKVENTKDRKLYHTQQNEPGLGQASFLKLVMVNCSRQNYIYRHFREKKTKKNNCIIIVLTRTTPHIK